MQVVGGGPLDTLAEQIAATRSDPLAHVMLVYPWGEPGTPLEHCAGPDPWQREVLIDIARHCRRTRFDGQRAVLPLLYGVSSGHGIGKTALVCWITKWLLDTRPYSRTTLTATTSQQLRNRTWAELAKWHEMSLTKGMFQIHNLRMESKDNPATHFAVGITSREENSEAFAGQHEARSTSAYIFDEASGVPDKIWEVAMGGLTDGEPFFFAFGNPTKNEGAFYDIWHGKARDMWIRRKIDSRSVARANTELVKRWVELYGEDSDFVRVRVRGEFPRASVLQFISNELVEEAMKRTLDRQAWMFAPRVMGVDVARYGDDSTVLCKRQGLQLLELKRYRELDLMTTSGLVADQIRLWRPNAVFVDACGIGAGVVDRLRQLGFSPIAVNSACKVPGRFTNRRSAMWGAMREWLQSGAALLPDDELKIDLTGPQYYYSGSDQLSLESKDDMRAREVASPDKADALALTFATDVYRPNPLQEMADVAGRLREEAPMLIGAGARIEHAQCRGNQDPFGGL